MTVARQDKCSHNWLGVVTLASFLALVGVCGPSDAAFIAQDNFSDGDRTVADNSAANGGGPGLTWFALADASSAAALTIVADDGSPGIGGGNSLNIRPNASGGTKPVITPFAPVSLAAIGDKLTASMDVRFISDVTTSTATNASFRVGFYNSNGTTITADGQRSDLDTGTGNDFGYFARIPIGDPNLTGNTSARLSKETGAASGATSDQLFGANNAAGTATGVTEVGTTTSFPITINTFDPHRIVLSLERTAAGVLTSIQVDATTPFTAEDTSSPFVTFDEFAMTNMRMTTEWRVDNVVIEAISIPEPTSLALLAIGLLLMTSKRITALTKSRAS